MRPVAGRVEGRGQQHLRGLDQGLKFFLRMRYPGDAFVWLYSDQENPSVGVGHASDQADDLSSQFLPTFFLCRTSLILVGAEEFEKLSALLPEQ